MENPDENIDKLIREFDRNKRLELTEIDEPVAELPEKQIQKNTFFECLAEMCRNKKLKQFFNNLSESDN